MNEWEGGCFKTTYATSADARIAVEKTKKRTNNSYQLQRIYHCPDCGGFHLTSMTKEVWQHYRGKNK